MTYEELPECIRQYYTESQYLWLSDEEKRDLIQTETQPEAENVNR